MSVCVCLCARECIYVGMCRYIFEFFVYVSM